MASSNSLLEKTFRLIYNKRIISMNGIPGPVPSFPLGTIKDFLQKGKQPWEVCREYGDRYGGMTLIWMGASPAIILNDPKLIEEVLISNKDSYYKDKPVMALRPVNTENTAFGANGKDWVTKRNNEPFCVKGIDHWLSSQIKPMQELIFSRIDNWKSLAQPIDLLSQIRRLMFDVFSVATCGAELGDDTYNDFVTMTTAGHRRMKSFLPNPKEPRSSKFKNARKRWFDRYNSLVEDARYDVSGNRNDLLSTLIKHGFDPPGTVLRDGIMNIPSGGVFSATSGVLSTLYLLNKHAEFKRILNEEIRHLPSYLNNEALESCTFLDATLRESLRYYCPVPIFFRNVKKEQSVQLGGFELPPDTEIFITSWRIHKDENNWENPDIFDPARWLNGGVEANPIGSNYFMPFGRGPRMCVGVQFSMTVMKLILASFVQNAKIEFIPDQSYEQDMFFGVMHPKNLKATFQDK